MPVAFLDWQVRLQMVFAQCLPYDYSAIKLKSDATRVNPVLTCVNKIECSIQTFFHRGSQPIPVTHHFQFLPGEKCSNPLQTMSPALKYHWSAVSNLFRAKTYKTTGTMKLMTEEVRRPPTSEMVSKPLPV